MTGLWCDQRKVDVPTLRRVVRTLRPVGGLSSGVGMLDQRQPFLPLDRDQPINVLVGQSEGSQMGDQFLALEVLRNLLDRLLAETALRVISNHLPSMTCTVPNVTAPAMAAPDQIASSQALGRSTLGRSASPRLICAASVYLSEAIVLESSSNGGGAAA